MNIPPLDVGKFVNSDGSLTAQANNFLTQLITQLQQGVGVQGFQIPILTAAQINSPAILAKTQIGTIVYDSTNNVFKGFVDVAGIGTWKTFTVT